MSAVSPRGSGENHGPSRRSSDQEPRPGAATPCPINTRNNMRDLRSPSSPDNGFKYTSFFADVLGDEGLPRVD